MDIVFRFGLGEICCFLIYFVNPKSMDPYKFPILLCYREQIYWFDAVYEGFLASRLITNNYLIEFIANLKNDLLPKEEVSKNKWIEIRITMWRLIIFKVFVVKVKKMLRYPFTLSWLTCLPFCSRKSVVRLCSCKMTTQISLWFAWDIRENCLLKWYYVYTYVDCQ